jgi:hypothetical protein
VLTIVGSISGRPSLYKSFAVLLATLSLGGCTTVGGQTATDNC